MVQTFAGAPLDPLGALRRPRHAGPVRRSHNTSVPGAWYCVCVEFLRVPKAPLPWNLWQGVASCPYSEVVAFRQAILLWQTLPDDPRDLIRRLPSPARVVKVLELLLLDSRASVAEVATLEQALLEHVDVHGVWTP